MLAKLVDSLAQVTSVEMMSWYLSCNVGIDVITYIAVRSSVLEDVRSVVCSR